MNPNEFEQRLKARRPKRIPEGWREELLRTAMAAGGNPVASSQPPVTRARWRDLLWPCPQAWAGLAVVWIGLLAFHSLRLSPARQSEMAVWEGGKRPDPKVLAAKWRELNEAFRAPSPPETTQGRKHPEPKAQIGPRLGAA